LNQLCPSIVAASALEPCCNAQSKGLVDRALKLTVLELAKDNPAPASDGGAGTDDRLAPATVWQKI